MGGPVPGDLRTGRHQQAEAGPEGERQYQKAPLQGPSDQLAVDGQQEDRREQGTGHHRVAGVSRIPRNRREGDTESPADQKTADDPDQSQGVGQGVCADGLEDPRLQTGEPIDENRGHGHKGTEEDEDAKRHPLREVKGAHRGNAHERERLEDEGEDEGQQGPRQKRGRMRSRKTVPLPIVLDRVPVGIAHVVSIVAPRLHVALPYPRSRRRLK